MSQIGPSPNKWHRNEPRRGSVVFAVLCVALLCGSSGGVRAADATTQVDEPFIFGFLPAYTPEKLVITFEPLVEYVSAKLRVPVKLETAPDFPEFVRRTHDSRRYDFLFTAPHLYYLAKERAGYRAVAQVKGGELRATIVALLDSDLTSPQQLLGKRLASSEPLAVITVLARAKLAELGLDPDKDLEIVTTPSHDASLQALLRKRTHAAVLPSPFFNQRLHPELKSKLRVIAETDTVPQMPISAASWVPDELVARLRDILLEMAGTPDGAMVLKRLGWAGFTETKPGDYAEMERFSKFAKL